MNTRKKFAVLATILAMLTVSTRLFSHCQIPCGIYDDEMRIQMIKEHIQTIEKSMNEITKLQKADQVNQNQLTRWIINKENHADQLTDIVTQYFMTQRIKPVEKTDNKGYQAYVDKLTLLHQLMVYSMKCKQTTDLDNVDMLREKLSAFASAYFGPEASSATSTQHEHSH